MAVNATRQVVINFSGDIAASETFSAAANATAPGAITLHSLAAGDNTITAPVSAGITVRGACILPPAGNAAAITLKGVGGDTGIPLSKLDPTSLAFEAGAPATFILNAGAIITGLRICWT